MEEGGRIADGQKHRQICGDLCECEREKERVCVGMMGNSEKQRRQEAMAK